MALTKDQRYLFCLEEGDSKTWLAKMRLMRVVGVFVLLSASLVIGRIVLAVYRFLMPMFLEQIQDNAFAIFGYLFVLVAVGSVVYGTVAIICNLFDVSYRALAILSGFLVVAPLLLFLVFNSGPPDIITLAALALFAFLGVEQNNGAYAIVSREKQRKKASIAIATISSQSDLAEIVVQSKNNDFVHTAWDKMYALAAAQPDPTEPGSLLRVAEGAKVREIRVQACDMLQHDWNGCVCKRCGKARNEQHDWDGCICKRCDKTRDEEHSWSDCACTRCKKQHDFNKDNVCKLCGGELVSETHETITYLPCNGCSNGSGYGCTGDTSNCIASESFQHFEYETVTYIVYPDGTKKPYSPLSTA